MVSVQFLAGTTGSLALNRALLSRSAQTYINQRKPVGRAEAPFPRFAAAGSGIGVSPETKYRPQPTSFFLLSSFIFSSPLANILQSLSKTSRWIYASVQSSKLAGQ